MEKYISIIFIFCINIMPIASEEQITIGKKYNMKDINAFTNLFVYAEVPIYNRTLTIYKIAGNTNKWWSSIYKIALLKDNDGSYLDAMGIILQDDSCYNTTSITDRSCLIKIQFDEMPIHQFLFFDSDSNKLSYFPIEHKFVADTCLAKNYIYYSTENDSTSIWRINILNRDVFTFPVYYPNVDLFEIDEKCDPFVLFTYNNQKYVIKDDVIKLADSDFSIKKKKYLKDFLIN
ncbi:hypothetical protein AGMMS50293_06080 [Spirochaetia bacterium]|nr:hypothetical protein AGMMS50293_06080 [Spirochaetia bacterium]